MNEQEQLISELHTMIEKPGGKQAARLFLNSMGAIPFVGGAIAGVGGIWGEKEQQSFNEAIVNWSSQANQDISKILAVLSEQTKGPTKAHLALLIGEVTGIDIASYPDGLQASLMLNNETINELQIFVQTGWISLQSNGNSMNMGAGNKIGNTIEDLKRTWGTGTGFILTVHPSYFNDN